MKTYLLRTSVTIWEPLISMGDNRVDVCKIRGYGLGFYTGLASLLLCSASQHNVFTKGPTSWFCRPKRKKSSCLVTLIIVLSNICHHVLENNILFLLLKSTRRDKKPVNNYRVKCTVPTDFKGGGRMQERTEEWKESWKRNLRGPEGVPQDPHRATNSHWSLHFQCFSR